MAEPASHTLSLTETERDVLERAIVMAAPVMDQPDQRVALGVWERVAKDTVAVDRVAGCACTTRWEGGTRVSRVYRDCPVHGQPRAA